MTEHLRTCVSGTCERDPAGASGAGASLEASVLVGAGAIPIVAIRGELDIATTGAFGNLMNDLMLRHGSEIVVDASGISFCDASGLGAFVRAANDACHAGGALILINLSQRLRRLLSITGLDDRLTAPYTRLYGQAS